MSAPDIRYKFSNKNNSKPLKATCSRCLEETVFRIITVGGANHVSCVRCLKYVPFNKKFRVAQHPIVKPTFLTHKEKVIRQWFRIKRWFKGDHLYGPFGRKRKKANW